MLGNNKVFTKVINGVRKRQDTSQNSFGLTPSINSISSANLSTPVTAKPDNILKNRSLFIHQKGNPPFKNETTVNFIK